MAVDGNWDMTLDTPMGKQSGKLVLARSGDTVTGHMEQMGNKVDLEDGTINDAGEMTFTANITSPMPMALKATGTYHEGDDKITGSVGLGAFGNAPFEATRAS